MYGYLASLPAASPVTSLPAVTVHEREQRRAAAAGSAPPGLLEQAAADGKTVRGAVCGDGFPACGSGTPACPAVTRRWSGRQCGSRPTAPLFNFFAALDGSAAINDPPHGQLRLTYISPDGSEAPLNLTGQASIPQVDELHALWTGEIFPYTEPLPG